MLGALVFVFGLPVSFEAAVHGESPNNALLVIGYIVMRVPLIALWLRAAREDPAHRATAVAYAVTIAVAQFAWLLTIVLPLSVLVTVLAIIAIALAEMVSPVVISLKLGRAPWHPGHIAERFSLLTLIALGEVVASTTVAVGALVESQNWSLGAIAIAVAGIVLVASLWWAYFLIPSRTLLERWPGRIWGWRYAHLPMFGAIAAVGAGLHVAAYAVEDPHISLMVVALALAIPVAAVIVVVYLTWSLLVRSFDGAHFPMLLVCLLPLAASVAVAGLAPNEERDRPVLLAVVIGLVALSAIVEVIVHERVGYRHTIAALERGNVSQGSAVD
jgi:low temperature requirement protein LtrA